MWRLVTVNGKSILVTVNIKTILVTVNVKTILVTVNVKTISVNVYNCRFDLWRLALSSSARGCRSCHRDADNEHKANGTRQSGFRHCLFWIVVRQPRVPLPPPPAPGPTHLSSGHLPPSFSGQAGRAVKASEWKNSHPQCGPVIPPPPPSWRQAEALREEINKTVNRKRNETAVERWETAKEESRKSRKISGNLLRF